MQRSRGLWVALRSIPGGATARLEWQRLLGGEWAGLAALLRPTGATVERVWCPSPGGDGCPRWVVRHRDGRIVAVCGDPEGQCNTIDLTLDDIVVHELDLEKLADALCRLPDLERELQPLSFAGPAWQVGWYEPVAGHRFAMALVLPVDGDQAHHAAVRLRGHYDRPFLVMMPTRTAIEPQTVEYLHAGRSRLLFLEEALSVEPATGWQLLRAAEDLLGDFRRDVLGEVRFGTPKHRFPTPPGTRWHNVMIRFISGHDVEVRVSGRSGGVYSYTHMDMAKANKDEPTLQWDLLRDLADDRGEVDWPKGVSRGTVRKRRDRLARHLQGLLCDRRPALRGSARQTRLQGSVRDRARVLSVSRLRHVAIPPIKKVDGCSLAGACS